MSEEIQTETQVKEQTEESNEKEVKNTDSNTIYYGSTDPGGSTLQPNLLSGK